LPRQPKKSDPDRLKYLLLMRFTLLNLTGFGVLGGAYLHGLVDMVLVSDQTHLSATIFVVFLAGLALCTQKVWQTSRDLNLIRDLNPLKTSRTAPISPSCAAMRPTATHFWHPTCASSCRTGLASSATSPTAWLFLVSS
jgi:hypothetical protein